MRIDLHLHSLISSLNGDPINWTSNREVIKTLKKHKVKIASFTDHNIFKKDFYDQMKVICKQNDILLLPGIELNVDRLNGIRSNIIYIFSNELSHNDLVKLEKITFSIGKKGISLTKVNTIFEEFRPLIIPHVGKSDYLGIEDLKQISFDAIEVSSIKHQNYKKFIKSDLKSSIVAFSDTHKWNNYPNLFNLHTKLDKSASSFEELKQELSKNKNYVYNIYDEHIER